MRVAPHAALITVRGPLPFRYLTQDLRLPESLVHETADVAFLLEPSFPANGSSWRQVYCHRVYAYSLAEFGRPRELPAVAGGSWRERFRDPATRMPWGAIPFPPAGIGSA